MQRSDLANQYRGTLEQIKAFRPGDGSAAFVIWPDLFQHLKFSEPLRCLAELAEVPEKIIAVIEASPRAELYAFTVQPIRDSTQLFAIGSMSQQWASLVGRIDATLLMALQTASALMQEAGAHLQTEEQATKLKDLQVTLLAMLQELSDGSDDDGLPAELRVFLLHSVRRMLEGIDLYRFAGTDALQAMLAEVIGGVFLYQRGHTPTPSTDTDGSTRWWGRLERTLAVVADLLTVGGFAVALTAAPLFSTGEVERGPSHVVDAPIDTTVVEP